MVDVPSGDQAPASADGGDNGGWALGNGRTAYFMLSGEPRYLPVLIELSGVTIAEFVSGAKLFGDDNDRRRRSQHPTARDREMQAKMNKTALVTLWVEPATAEVRKYTFDNLGLGFLPLSWLVRVSEMRANVNMIEPFEGILLPGTVDIRVAVSLANGTYHLRYDLEYYGYKQARVRSTLLPPR